MVSIMHLNFLCFFLLAHGLIKFSCGYLCFLDVTKILCELELTIQRVKVMTTPDDKVLDLFFITDGM